MPLRSVLSRLSISTRLALWFGLSLLVLLTLFVTGLYVSVHLGLHQDLETQLREEAKAVQAHLRAHGGEMEKDPTHEPSGELASRAGADNSGGWGGAGPAAGGGAEGGGRVRSTG